MTKRTTFEHVQFLAAVALLGTGGSSLAAQGTELPRAEDLFERHVEATGGRAAHLALRSRERIGSLSLAMAGHELEARVEEHYLAPGKAHTLIDGPHLSQVDVCDGVHAWRWHQAAEHGSAGSETELLEGAEAALALEKARLHRAAEWRDWVTHAQTVGVARIDGEPAWEVRVERARGEPSTEFYSQASGRLVGTWRKTSSHMGELEMHTFLRDYREFDGVWLPMVVHTELNSSTLGEGRQTFTYSSVRHGVEIPESLFAMPEEIAAKVREAESAGEERPK